MKVLIVDNNAVTLDFFDNLLSKEGFEVIKSQSGEDAINLYKKEDPDFICLDIMMPDMSGFDVCREIRKNDEDTPIVFISSKDQVIDKVTGLEIGADDYITKPFDTHEVNARIRAVARRSLKNKNDQKSKKQISEPFMIGDLEIIPSKLAAMRGSEAIDINLRDIKILKLLADHENDVVQRDILLDYCWGAHIMPESRTVDWHISKLRQKIEIDPKNPVIVTTVHGVGFRYAQT